MIYIVPTPIGNLEDITLRALRVLKESKYIFCEDTRTTKKLLDHYDIKSNLISYHKHNEKSRVNEIINLSLQGEDISIVSDAGMPAISDPGNILIMSLIEENVEYTVLPGASAFTTALVLSGFDSLNFSFLGFIPTKKSEKDKIYEEIKERKETLIFYESPHRIKDTLKDLSNLIPNRNIAVVREISKIYEEAIIFKASDYDKKDITEKGEIVLLIDKDDTTIEYSDEDIKNEIIKELDNGLSKKMAVKSISKELNISKNRVYDISLKI